MGGLCLDGHQEALEPIDTSDEGALHAPVARLSDHLQPESREG